MRKFGGIVLTYLILSKVKHAFQKNTWPTDKILAHLFPSQASSLPSIYLMFLLGTSSDELLEKMFYILSATKSGMFNQILSTSCDNK